MVSASFCHSIPKVELHVHLEGSVRPETLLQLARRHQMPLPADTVEGLQEWYTFRDFPHFEEIYVAISQRIKTIDDLELIAREFFQGQAAQNILHSEITYTASTLEKHNGLPWAEQLKVLERVLEYAGKDLGVTGTFIIDIVRGDPVERAEQVVDWAIEGFERGVVGAQGLAGQEALGTLQYASAIKKAEDAGMPFIPHAAETTGPQTLHDCFTIGHPLRIGHGVRCVEDAFLVKRLRDEQVPLEVCPSSNVCLGVYPNLAAHVLPRLLDEGLCVTVNSDDPPMFNTTLSDELFRTSQEFGFNSDILWTLQMNALRSSLLGSDVKRDMMSKMREGFADAEDEGEEEE